MDKYTFRKSQMDGWMEPAADPGEEFYLASEVDAAAAEGTLTANAQRDAVIEAMEKSLRNCLLLAMREAHGDPRSHWAHIIRFCAEAGIVPSPLRSTD